MKTLILFTTLLALVVSGAQAQCTTGGVGLAVGATGPVAPGDAVPIAINGVPGAEVILVLGPQPGTTLGPGGAVLCIAPVIGAANLGPIPFSGILNAVVPAIGNPGGVVLYQALTVMPGPAGATVDTSNVAGVPIGLPPCQHSNSIGLAVHPDMPVQPGDTLTFAVQAPPGSFALLAYAANLGQTPLVPGLDLCLGMPLDVAILGAVPSGGIIAAQSTVPPNVMLPGNVTLYFQAIALVATSAGLALGTSNLDLLVF